MCIYKNTYQKLQHFYTLSFYLNVFQLLVFVNTTIPMNEEKKRSIFAFIAFLRGQQREEKQTPFWWRKNVCFMYLTQMCVFVPCNANFIVAVLKTEICRPKNKVKPSNFVVIKRLREFSSNVPSFTKKNCEWSHLRLQNDLWFYAPKNTKSITKFCVIFLHNWFHEFDLFQKLQFIFHILKIQKWVGKWHIILIILYLTKIYKKNAQIGIVRQEYYYWWMIIFQAQNNLKNENMME